ncbi:energy transducer TonB [Pseudomonas putida]|uniref:TonB family protein n=1 Tax=Pseudomonas putida TaxID=303 RepID=A0A9X8HI97_PSEPU|nr:TonB family protein [Pseudomonas putida]ROQ46326.1 TonB family protein [Pseudomonas putida]
MKRWLGILLCWCCAVQAEHVPTFAQPPAPVYPRAMRLVGLEGAVRIGYQVDSRDGSVSHVTVKHSDHALFSASAEAAIAKVRFEPWTVAAGEPVKTDVVQSLLFRMDEQSMAMTLDAQAALPQLQCKLFSYYLATYRQIRSHQPLWQMDSVATAIGLLARTSSASPTLLQFKQAQQAFEAALPSIERRCAGQPDLMFIDAWPQQLRDLALKQL